MFDTLFLPFMATGEVRCGLGSQYGRGLQLQIVGKMPKMDRALQSPAPLLLSTTKKFPDVLCA
jgi:hypothetical protein